jgi:hypothetical protein
MPKKPESYYIARGKTPEEIATLVADAVMRGYEPLEPMKLTEKGFRQVMGRYKR